MGIQTKNVIHRASKPSRPEKGRKLGYKAKQGFIIYRVRVRRGNRKRPAQVLLTVNQPTKVSTIKKVPRASRATAEERVGRKSLQLKSLKLLLEL